MISIIYEINIHLYTIFLVIIVIKIRLSNLLSMTLKNYLENY